MTPYIVKTMVFAVDGISNALKSIGSIVFPIATATPQSAPHHGPRITLLRPGENIELALVTADCKYCGHPNVVRHGKACETCGAPVRAPKEFT